MKKLLLLTVAAGANGMVLAQEVGRVISSTPIIQQVGVPRQVCTTEQVTVQQPKSGAGAVMGAIAGGALGNAVGGGSGKAAATMLGIFGGAVLGDRVEGAPLSQVQDMQRCGVQTFYENRPVAYNVVYEYAGKQYSVQMANDPGPSIQLQVTPIGAAARGPETTSTGAYVAPEYGQPANVYVVPPVNRGYYANPTYANPYYANPYYASPYYASPYYASPYYAPVGIQLDYVYGDGHRRRRH